jgi:intracellular sulfur oxidation DsrE/DsrF family protein
MMKTLLTILWLAITPLTFAQKKEKEIKKETVSVQEPRKIVMQLTSGDTTVHKMLMKQLSNILTVAPDTKIEVVCHGPGLSMLVESASIVNKKIIESKTEGVDFVACRYSMKERNVAESAINSAARIVEAGILEIVDRQNEGYVYIKAG